MKYLLFFIFPFSLYSQKNSFLLCDSVSVDKFKLQYYSFNIKYPLSSERLTMAVNQTLTYQPKQINGFITIRFIVNCTGQTGNFEIYQIDNNYQNTKFEDEYIEQLLDFVKSLDNWKIAIYKDKNYDYYTYFTFKIEHGKVIEIGP